MEFSFDTAPSQDRRSALRSRLQSSEMTGSQSLSSDRLQKAIERNRAKQARRSTMSTSAPQGGTSQEDITEALKQRLLKKREAMQTTRQASLPQNAPSAANRGPSLRERLQSQSRGDVVVMPKARPTRKNVAVAGQATFNEPQKKTKLPAPIRYLGLGKSANTSKVKRKSKKMLDHLVIFGWICMALLSVRLIFSDRGIVDFYKHKSALQSIQYETQQLEVDNRDLVTEIEKIRTSARHQKKIVRDYLGFIAQNEYLILFAKGRTPASDTN